MRDVEKESEQRSKDEQSEATELRWGHTLFVVNSLERSY